MARRAPRDRSRSDIRPAGSGHVDRRRGHDSVR
jgi:hypothetical protein